MTPAAGAAAGRLPILALVNNFMMGGTERHVVRLAQAIDRERFEMHIACFRRVGELLEEMEGSCATLSEYPIHRLYGPRATARQAGFARQLRRQGIRLASTYGFHSNVFGIPAARAAGVPVVLASVRDQGDHLTPLKRYVQKVMCRLAHGVLVNSEAVRQRLLAEGWDGRRISVIRNGVDLTSRDREEAEAVRRELGLPRACPLVAAIGRLTPMKGLEYFLDAAAAVAARVPAARFLVVGSDREGPVGYRAGLEAHARSQGVGDKVVFAGMRCDVTRLLSAVDVAVQPSLSEGLSNVLLESMAAGVPVVATQVGGSVETIEDGVSGLLVAPRDAANLASAVVRILEDADFAARLGAAGRERIARGFSRERMVRETESLYLRLLEESAGRGTRAIFRTGTACC